MTILSVDTPPTVRCTVMLRSKWGIAAWGILRGIFYLIVLGLLLWFMGDYYTRHNRFPVYFHPDEWTKGEQVREESRNFNHPQLMLESALRLIDWRGQDPKLMTLEEIVFAGRDASGYLSAGAAVMLAIAGLCVGGWRGLFLGAIAGALCPPLLAHSRYFKEEPSLCFGVAGVVMSAALMFRFRHWAWQLPLSVIMGVGTALAASGKYAGVVMVVPALLAVLMGNYRRWWILPALLFLMAYAGWTTWQEINWRAMDNWHAFMEGFEREKDHAANDHMGVTMEKPTMFFIDQMWDDAMPHIRLLALASPASWLLMRRRRGAKMPVVCGSILFPAWLGLTLIIYTAAVSYSSIPFFRYIVPASMLLYFFAAIGLIWVVKLIEKPMLAQGVFATGIVVMAFLQANRTENFNQQFIFDSRILLAQWVREHLPPETRIAADGYTELNQGPQTDTRARVDINMFVPSIGSIEELRSRGIRYIAVAGTAYERFLDPHTFAVSDAQRGFARRNRMYRALFEEYPVVWIHKAEHPMKTFTNPDIYVFRIADRNDAPPPRRNRWSR